MDDIERLHVSLDSRLNPEATAALILKAIGQRLLPSQRRLLSRAADSPAGRYSSMSDDYRRPDPLTHKVTMMLTLLGTIDRVDTKMIEELAEDPWKLLGQLRIAGKFNGWNPDVDFKSRRNREQRGGMPISRRQYNRLVRHLIRTQAAAHRMGRQVLLRQLILVASSGLAATITLDDVYADPDAAAFVAYWTSVRKRRREFSLAGRDNPFDPIVEMLLTRCELRPHTDWSMIARVYPQPKVIARLDDERIGDLLGRWSSYMGVAAGMLKELHAGWPTRDVPPTVPDDMWASRPDLMPSAQARGARTELVVDLETMVVRPGVDSATWNAVAGAYNAARAGWINCLAAAGALDLLEVACPGKAMRFMAADLQAYHLRTYGSAANSQTLVWARLPMPWQVIAGYEACPATLVEQVCSSAGLDARQTGWTAPRAVGGTVAAWKPTPELVHGIEVRDPLWAGLLRAAGAWSGKPAAGAGTLYDEYAKGVTA